MHHVLNIIIKKLYDVVYPVCILRYFAAKKMSSCSGLCSNVLTHFFRLCLMRLFHFDRHPKDFMFAHPISRRCNIFQIASHFFLPSGSFGSPLNGALIYPFYSTKKKHDFFVAVGKWPRTNLRESHFSYSCIKETHIIVLMKTVQFLY